jgi:hypothetical protein
MLFTYEDARYAEPDALSLGYKDRGEPDKRFCDSCHKMQPADCGGPVIGGGWRCGPCDDLVDEAYREMIPA